MLFSVIDAVVTVSVINDVSVGDDTVHPHAHTHTIVTVAAIYHYLFMLD